MSDLLQLALQAAELGFCVLPPKEDGSKRPLVPWQEYQERRPEPEELRRWYAGGRSGIGLLCGAVSGNLEMLEFEGRAVASGLHHRYRELAEQAGLGELLTRILEGCSEETPSGGIHLLYRCLEPVSGNTKLARRPATAEELEENPDDRIKVLIETRGEGGYVVTAPSNGRVHPSGGAYRFLRGGFESIVTISAEEREALLDLARSFDRMPHSETESQPPPARSAAPGGHGELRPGDDYEARASWSEILEPHGWRPLFTARDGNQHWQRPGKRMGTSATINEYGRGVLYVFSSSTPFTDLKGYSKFGAYAVLEHGGNFKLAAAELRRRGYGSAAEPSPNGQMPREAEPEPEEPIPAPTPTRMPFPLEALPAELAAWVEEAAAAMKTPADFPALAALVFCSAAIGASRELVIKQGWRERVAIWGAIVGPPGLAKKTPALQTAVEPISKIQRNWLREHREQLEQYEEELAAWERDSRSKDRGPKPERPIGRRVLISDTTVEKLAELLSENPRGLVLHRDELAGWVGSMDQYKKNGQGSDREHYLSMWAGVDIVVDRKVNPIPVSVTHPFLSVIGGIQPDLVTGLRQRMRDDGFTDRILFSWPEVLTDQSWSEASIGSRAWSNYYVLFERLLALQMEEEEHGYLRPRGVHMEPAAKTAWVRFYDEHAQETMDVNLDPRLLGIYQKLVSYAARFALLHHLIGQAYDPGDGRAEVSELSVTSGWALADYFKAHAGYVYGLFGRNEEDSRAEQLVAWLRRHEGSATARDVVRAGAAGVRKTSEVMALFRDLQDRGWAVIDEVPVAGGKQHRLRLLGVKP